MITEKTSKLANQHENSKLLTKLLFLGNNFFEVTFCSQIPKSR